MRIDERLRRPMAHQYCEDTCKLSSLPENADGQVRRARSQIPGQEGVGRRNGQLSYIEAQRQSDDSATSICSEQAHPRQEFPSRDGRKSFALAPWLKRKFMPRTSVWCWS